MGVDLRGRNFLSELDFTPAEWRGLLQLASHLKNARYHGREVRYLSDKVIALVFAKTSTRTRCSFEVAAYHQGAQVTYLDPAGSQLGHKESIADTAAVLGRYYDGIQFRGGDHADVEALAAHAQVPVWNGLTDTWHPTQSLCDVLTMAEHSSRPLSQVSVAYVGDAHNNVANSLLLAGALMGMEVRMVSPSSLQPAAQVQVAAERVAATTGARLHYFEEVAAGVAGVDFIYTDVWVSMGEPAEVWDERIQLLTPYQVNTAMMEATGNPDTKFMHCLPAFHDRHTSIGAELYERTGLEGLEVTDAVFQSPASIVFDQAENRLHTIKAILVATLVGDPTSAGQLGTFS